VTFDAASDASDRGERVSVAEHRERIGAELVGRERELELLLSAVAAGRDIVLEGPPGTSKTTMLKAITTAWGIPLTLVEGNGELTPVKLVGHHDPARVLKEDYNRGNFVPGPLVTAMTEGGFLYVEEINRAPEDTLNMLLMAIAEREIAIPRVGVIKAEPTFRLVASMNPFDNVGTLRLSASVHDRLCRLAVGYQDEEAERAIVRLRTGIEDDEDGLAARMAVDAVAGTRATRVHPDIRQGSSVRGAIDTVLVARELAALRGIEDATDERYPEMFLEAFTLALSGRIQLDEVADTTPEGVLRQIWEDLFILLPAAAEPG
jgi:MoxR-like ATPase